MSRLSADYVALKKMFYKTQILNLISIDFKKNTVDVCMLCFSFTHYKDSQSPD